MRFFDTIRARGEGIQFSNAALKASLARAAENFGQYKFNVVGIVRQGRELTITYRRKRRQIKFEQLRDKVALFSVSSGENA